MRVGVYGLWHLGCVTAACLAEAGHHVVGLDPDREVLAALRRGCLPVHEPGLQDLLAAGRAAGRLSFSDDPREALADAEVLWITLDTPIDESDDADHALVRDRIEALSPWVIDGTLVLLSSQVPVGFTRALSRDWAGRGLIFAYSPENLRLGRALESFREPGRVVVGTLDAAARDRVSRLLAPFDPPLEWMGLESAEMTKHALNAFLASSVAFINEIARLCEGLGADARDVERGLKTDARIGPGAYLSPGGSFAGGTLARDVRYLVAFGERLRTPTPFFEGLLASNAAHARWQREQVRALLAGISDPVAAVLGLTYKPGTSTLRRSASVDLCRWIQSVGARVQAHDPAVDALPVDLAPLVRLCGSAAEALRGADVAVIATSWPEYGSLTAGDLLSTMRKAQVVDPSRLLEDALAHDPRILYLATGKPRDQRG